ncbi:hypothetical protein JCM10212_004308 [Sporobolomyces blumeae]
MKERLAVLVLDAEGDRFNACYTSEGELGGRQAAELVCLLTDEMLKEATSDDNVKLAVYLVSTDSTASSDFLRGFASTPNNCVVVQAEADDATARIAQLVDLYLPLESVAFVLVGSLNSDALFSSISALSPTRRSKVVLVSTIDVAPAWRNLAKQGQVQTWRGIEDLFGGTTPPFAFGIERGQPELYTLTVSDAGDISLGLSSLTLSEAGEAQGQSRQKSDSDDSSDWQVASPRSAKPVTSPASPSSPGASPSESGSSPRMGATSGAARRRDRRYRSGRRETGRREKSPETEVAQADPPLISTPKGPVSPLPAWDPPVLGLRVKPPPCLHHYLSVSGCYRPPGTCPYSHAYPFSSDERRDYRKYIKSILCVQLQHNERCTLGEQCLMGHRCPYTFRGCPYGARCFYRLKGLPHSSTPTAT